MMRIITWNVNSVRLRLDQTLRLLQEHRPDVLCLQEIKCPTEKFPSAAFRAAGYGHLAVHGPRDARHGVATIARTPFEVAPRREWCGLDDGRHVAVRFENGVTVDNFYVPAGGDEPDPEINPKFAHKLSFLEEMVGAYDGADARVLVGDLNVAPGEHDVWSHKQLLKVVSHTPVETSLLEEVRTRGRWVDVGRELIPAPERLFTWWSYRAKDWRKSDRGRRLDHIWLSEPLAGRAASAGRDSYRVLEDARSWERPSDHAPVVFDAPF